VNPRTEVLLWAQRVISRKAAPAHEILELPAQAGPEKAQEAFHKIARSSHPDLHRKGLTPEELETVTSAYAIVAGAYQIMRTQTMQTTRMKPVGREDSAPIAVGSGETPPAGSANVPAGRATPFPRAPSSPGYPRAPSPSPSVPTTPAGPAPAANAGQSMSPKALVYYRKAELSLKRGDLRGAVLQLKLAIAADPASAFLRTALAEVELEVRKGP